MLQDFGMTECNALEIGNAGALGGCYRANCGSTEKELGFEERIIQKGLILMKV